MHSKRNLATFLFTLLFSFYSHTIQAQQVNKALELFLDNKMNESIAQLSKIANDVSHKERGKAGVALALIHKLNDNSDDKVKYYVLGLKHLDVPDAYAYTLWGDSYFHNYPKYSSEVLEIFRSKPTVHPDINYCLDNLVRRRMIMNNQFDSVLRYNKERGAIDALELLGPFDYGDGFGYYNDQHTLAHADTAYEFRGRFNSRLHWFPLIKDINVAELLLNEHIEAGSYGASKMYVQSFLESDAEQDVMLNIISGSDIRCWLNDALVYENRRNIENIGSLPFRFKLHLNKGVNRLLFQVGKKTNYSLNFELYIRDMNDKPLASVRSQLAQRNYQKQTTPVAVITDPDVESFNVQVFSDYIKAHPNDILEQMLRVEELSSTGDKSKTLKALQGLRQKYPNSYYVSNLYYNNKENINNTTKDKYLNENCENCYSTLSQKYDEAIEEKNKNQIRETLDKLEKNFPGNISVLYRRIDYLMEENEYAEAAKLIDEGMSKYENFLVFQSYKNSLLKAQAKKAENLEFLKSILPGRNNTFVSDRLKSYYLEENDTAHWMEIHQNDLRWDKSDENYYSLLNMHNASKKYDLSEKVILDFLAKKPYDAGIWEAYGELMVEKGNKARALEYYNRSLEYYPLDYELIKKIRIQQGVKPELDLLLPETMKELFSKMKIDKMEIPLPLKNRSWVILLKKSASVQYDAGVNVSRNFVFYKILKEAGITEFKEFSAGGMGSDVMIFKEDGQVVLPESGFGSMVLPDLKVGDIIGLKMESESSGNNEYLTTRYKTVNMSMENEPVILLEEDNIISKSVTETPIFFDKNKLLKTEKKDWNKEFVLYHITSKNPLYIEPELAPADPLFNNAFQVMHNYKSWDEVAKWYWEIASPRLVSDDKIRTLVPEILKGHEKESALSKAALIYKWIVTNINYSSQGFRQDNYVPQLPTKVLEDKLGDCKDLAALYIVMLREVGIKANFCLVNMDYRASLFRLFPNVNFNHCIARIYPDNKPLFVELTSRYLPFAQSANYSSFGFGLEIDSAKTTSASDLYNEGRFDHFEMRNRFIQDAGQLKVDGLIRFTGLTGAVIRDAFQKIDSTQINTSLKQLVGSFIPNNNFESCSYDDKDLTKDTVEIRYKLTNNDMFTDVAEMHVYKLPSILNKIVDEGLFANSERKTSLSLVSAINLILESGDETIIAIPEKMKMLKMPENKTIHNQFFDFDVNIKEIGKELHVKRTFKANSKVIEASDFPLFKTEMEKAYKMDVVTLVMQ